MVWILDTDRALRISIGLAIICVSLNTPSRGQTSNPGEFFESRIRPVLVSRCYSCHTEMKSGGLRLDSRDNLLRGGSDGAVIEPGHSENSLLLKALRYTDEHLKMPLNGPKLDDETIENFAKWIRDGAVWPESEQDFFTARVRPALSTNCLGCHSTTPQAGLMLDTREHLLKGGKSGPAIVPGDPDKSLLIQAVLQKHAGLKMPPTKRLADNELADLVEWVKKGALWSGGALTPATAAYQITPEQRAFWSFQPPQNPVIPKVKKPTLVRTPVDNFIEAKLEEKGLKPAPVASKRALIRRATYDLTGLPPTPPEVDAFLADKSPQAFAKVVDRLLASPHYGERWGRHWLDLVRYADCSGDSADYPIPQAYLYRNYVIYSFNRDKPYDQFIREQIAGDLMPAHSEAEKWDHTVATGYLAIAKRFGVEPETEMQLTIDDTIDNLGKTFLGMSIACARCHNHKYDPISSADYYALYGIFDSTRYPFPGSDIINEQLDLAYRTSTPALEAKVKAYVGQLGPLTARMRVLIKQRDDLDDLAMGVPVDPKLIVHRSRDDITKEIDGIQKQRTEIRTSAPVLETAFAVAEGTPHDAPVLLRGDPAKKDVVVPRHFLQILGGQPLPSDCKSSGRLQLAQWLADPKNPLTARVMVNRIWLGHFGMGIVASPSDFGKRGKPPTHPELLDYLATRFMQSGWSIKAMHRLIMLSEAYQRSSDGPEANSELDPNNDFYWKFNRQRLDAESIRDAMLKVSGDLDPSIGKAHPFPPPLTWKWDQHHPFVAVYETNQRSIYLMVQRSQRHPYLSMFDGADPNMSTPDRTSSITPLQALFFMNSDFMQQRSEHWAARLLDDAPDDEHRLNLVCATALGRPLTPAEKQRALAYLSASRKKLPAADVSADLVPQEAWASFLRALLASNEFIYID